MRDKKIWIFNAGNAFDGNPKWLFMYIVNYRKDITPYWFCYTEETRNYIRKLGYQAFLFKSKMAEKIGSQAGVYVVNQKKEVFQDYLKGITVLNLWHGVGCKTVEKGVTYGFLNERIIKKHIINMDCYQNYQLFLVTSPLMEKHFIKQCDLAEDKIIRAGYPCCFYPGKIKTYDHDILKQKKLPEDTKIAVYAPTYRDASATNFFSQAIPDMEKLVDVLEKNNFLLIFKMHPLMANDFQYQNIKKIYTNCPRVLFWDNANDFYEIFDRIDLAIVDYSSIFYDMLASGVKHFARYIFDYGQENTLRDFALDYMENTCGKICTNFQEFLEVFSKADEDESEEIARIYKKFWEYADEHSLEKIVDAALLFEPDESKKLPTLYSFDIFDTLIGRSTLLPIGVFYHVQDKMRESKLEYPKYIKENFYKIRPWAESNVREYYRKSIVLRKDRRTEITFDLIYERIKELYSLTDEQTEQLKKWELECEYETSIPYPEKIQQVKDLIEQGETVVLISDMYLPKEFIKKLLCKAEPILGELPLFLSSDYGTQKTTKELFFDVYHAVEYRFGKWIHYGDNKNADGKVPASIGIESVNHEIPAFDFYEKNLTQFIATYDSYQIAALFARFRQEEHRMEEVYAYSYVSLYWVPYVNWAIRHALEKKIDCLYFISRDGYHLKRIADAIIKEKKLSVKTKYIYGSRKAWRIPSQIYEIDEEFFGEFGNFVDIEEYDKLLEAASMTSETFESMFPELAYLKEKKIITRPELKKIREAFSVSEKYEQYLLQTAAEQRKIVLEYLNQEIDFSEKYAFVEFWGRGYTQNCLARLLWKAAGYKHDNIFYYARSIYPSNGHLIRYNFTGNTYSQIFIESIFANLPYRSVSSYERKNGKVEPVLNPCDNNQSLHNALERYLPEFATDFCRMIFENEESIGRSLFDFGISFFHNNKSQDIFLQMTASLYDSVALYGKTREYAPPITMLAIIKWARGGHFGTKDFNLSLARSAWSYRFVWRCYRKWIHGTKYAEKIKKLRERR